ncbi:hypothetical protein QVD17_19897 [Tagetes erecta]|uniref:RNase H type-1 domain-containing protein n=1 Tax=Tagetes erecta TaxID=13708 RepID=A0AAD8KK98_TARER|nr:hypothetical protein QVD17_19897 [Tagetes erecta]
MSMIFNKICSSHIFKRLLIRNCHKKTEPIKVSWKKPEIGWKKLNFDGSCKWETGKASIGGVVRDHNAQFLFGYAESIGKSNSTVAEFAALRRGLELVLENGYSDGDIWVEGDYKTLVEIIMLKKDVKCVEVQKHVSCIKVLLPEFRNFFVTHVYRQGNRVADKFARIGHELERPKIWHICPSEVVGIVKDDANGKVVLRMR